MRYDSCQTPVSGWRAEWLKAVVIWRTSLMKEKGSRHIVSRRIQPNRESNSKNRRTLESFDRWFRPLWTLPLMLWQTPAIGSTGRSRPWRLNRSLLMTEWRRTGHVPLGTASVHPTQAVSVSLACIGGTRIATPRTYTGRRGYMSLRRETFRTSESLNRRVGAPLTLSTRIRTSNKQNLNRQMCQAENQ